MAWKIKDGNFVNDTTGVKFLRRGSGAKGGNGLRHDNGASSGTKEEFNKLVEHYLNTGQKDFSESEFYKIIGKVKTNNAFEVLMKDLNDFISYHGLDDMKLEKQLESGLFVGEGGKNYDLNLEYQIKISEIDSDESLSSIEKEKAKSEILSQAGNNFNDGKSELNPYVDYMQQMQDQTYQNELGLLTEQNRAAQQQAEISSQQMMMQNSQFKDQLIEQIKTDRMSKLRSGMSQMQIANEEMQFMVGNQMQNQQAVSQANQQLLGAKQQEGMIPYQAWLNASQGVTGGQGYGNFASGMAATDASSLFMQAQEYMKFNPGATPQEAWDAVQGNPRYIAEKQFNS